MLKYIKISLFFLLSGTIFATDLDQIITGSILFIESDEPCKVYINEEYKGITPLFITDIDNDGYLSINGQYGFYDAHISYQTSNDDVTFFKTELNKYHGFLKIVGSESKSYNYYLDGTEVSFDSLNGERISEGRHLLTVESRGYATLNREIFISRLETLDLLVDLKREVMVGFSQILPDDAKIEITNLELDKSYTFKGNEPIKLYSGDWTYSITHPTFTPLYGEFILEDEVMEIAIELDLLKPTLILDGLLANSIILLNDIDVTATLDGDILPVPIGVSTLSITKDKYSPIFTTLNIDTDDAISLNLEYSRDPYSIRSSKTTKSISFLGSGILMLAGGLYMNSDDFIIGKTSNYKDYTTMKYGTLGLAGVGAILSVVGSYFGISSMFVTLPAERG